jgi:hypothetical protein
MLARHTANGGERAPSLAIRKKLERRELAERASAAAARI